MLHHNVEMQWGSRFRRGSRRRIGTARRRVSTALDSLAGRTGVPGEVARRLRARVDTRSLAPRAAASVAPYTRADLDFLRDLEVILGGRPIKRVALLVDERSGQLPTWMAGRWPKAKIVCLTSVADVTDAQRGDHPSRVVIEVAPNPSIRHALLTAHGRFDAIVDWAARSPRDRLAVFEESFFHLRRGGAYVTTVDPGEPSEGLVALLDRLGSTAPGDQGSAGHTYADAIAHVQRRRHSLLVECGATALPKLRYHEMDRVLAVRPSVGRVLSSLPAETYPSRAVVTVNRENPGVPLATTIKVPSLGLREYRDVTCAPYQVLVASRILIPDSYRHYLNRTLTNAHTTDLSVRFARPRKKLRPSRELFGTYFYLGSEAPQHFGHVMTEQLSRLWAWPEIKDRYPQAKALIDLRRRHDGLRQWEIDIFSAAGVDATDLVPITGIVRVEKLLAATPMFVNTQYAHPKITEVWARTASALVEQTPHRPFAEKVFISRRGSRKNRQCENAEEVETFFRGRGFDIVFPEDHSLPEQVMIFRQARVLAGFAGSGLFTMLFCEEPKPVVMIWPETYTSRNEYLICSAIGHRLFVFWCAPRKTHPSGGWDAEAYQSSYAFDFERDGVRLDETLSQL